MWGHSPALTCTPTLGPPFLGHPPSTQTFRSRQIAHSFLPTPPNPGLGPVPDAQERPAQMKPLERVNSLVLSATPLPPTSQATPSPL